MVIVRAPVRISFGGGGTDLDAYYTHFGGFVVNAAITRYCYVVADQSGDGGIHINSADYRIWETYSRGEIPSGNGPLALPKAAIAWFANHGLLEKGIDLFLTCEVLSGTGLGSFSAMAVALVRALAAHVDTHVGACDAAELACWLEIEGFGMPIGKQNQYASAYGGLNAIEFNTNGVSVIPLALPADVITALSAHLLLFSTGQTHHDSAANLRQQWAYTRTKTKTIVTLHWLVARYPGAAIQENLGYLQKREAHMQYPTYQAAGWPIGSGSVESANKVVVEARLKGAGMRWERENVNPMLVLRNAVCNRRWDETWQAARRQRQQSRHQLRGKRIQARYEQAWTHLLTLWLWFRPSTPRPVGEPTPRSVSSPAANPRGPRRPAATHPWRRPLVVRPTEAVRAKNEPHPPVFHKLRNGPEGVTMVTVNKEVSCCKLSITTPFSVSRFPPISASSFIAPSRRFASTIHEQGMVSVVHRIVPYDQ